MTKNFKTTLTDIAKRAGNGLQRAGESTGNWISEKTASWHVRDKIVKILPQDLASSLPRTFEPLAVADWITRAVQRQGSGFYGRLITILLCTYFLADVAAQFAQKLIPDPPMSRAFRTVGLPKHVASPEDYNVIVARNLFSSQRVIPGEESGPGGMIAEDMGGAPVKTNLPFTLVGTMILRDELRSIATIEDKAANMIYPVRVTDEIPSKAKVIKIEPRKVIFLNTSSGRREYVELPLDSNINSNRISLGSSKNNVPGIDRLSPTQYSISRNEVDKSLADLNNVLTQARCVPNTENGLPAGYKCFQIVPGSIYDKLGMQNNDVITAINGQSINDPAKAFEQLQAMKDSPHIDMTIKRDGRPMTFSYDIR